MGVAICVLFSLGWANRRNRKRLIVLGIAAILTVALARPAEAQGLGILQEVMAVLSTINRTIGSWLTNIHTVQNDIRQTQQTIVWPQQLIVQAHGWASSWVNNYKTPMLQLFAYRPASAALASAAQLEQVLVDGNGGTLPSLLGRYRQLYGSVPTAAQMKPEDRDMTDMDDTLAVDTLEQLKRGDQVNEAIRASGDSLEQMSTQAAPGTSAFVTATALVTMLKSQAVTQKMLATFLRQNGAQLAHQTAAQKQAIQATFYWHRAIRHTLAR
jgi:hypothetical protein